MRQNKPTHIDEVRAKRASKDYVPSEQRLNATRIKLEAHIRTVEDVVQRLQRQTWAARELPTESPRIRAAIRVQLHEDISALIADLEHAKERL